MVYVGVFVIISVSVMVVLVWILKVVVLVGFMFFFLMRCGLLYLVEYCSGIDKVDGKCLLDGGVYKE